MSMITACPACGTMFRVVADQLRISDGWVRCGHCTEVFDASVHMQPEQRAPGETAPQSRAHANVGADAGVADAGLAASAPPGDALRVATSGSTAAADEPAPAPAALTPWSAPSGFEPSSLPFEEAEYLPVPLVRAEIEPVPSARNVQVGRHDDAVDDEPAAPLQDVSFVRDARRQAFWRQPLVRSGLALLALVLGCFLAAQVAVQERDGLAAAEPGSLPLLEQLCQPLGCRIGAPRRIEAIAIDSSGFSKLRPDTYRLSVTLKNQASTPVAVPALELTLTDLQDQPLLRRVLLPSELGAPQDAMAARADWSTTVALAVNGVAASRVAGYRLLAFYP